MKKVSAILMSVFFIASGLRVSIDSHYCDGNLFATKISLTGEKATCGMENNSSSNYNNQLVIDSKCCEDLMSSISLNNNFFPEYFQVDKPFPAKQVMIFQDVIISDKGFNNPEYTCHVFPPGNNLHVRLSQPDICIFRI